MCYSALVKKKLREYEREFGVRLSLAQFELIFGFRAEDPRIRIPRAVEDQFADPTSPAERRIWDMIVAHRNRTAADLERELFEQLQRKNDAERSLQTKITKRAETDVRVGTKKADLAKAKLEDLKRTEAKTRDARIFPMTYAPIVIREGGEGQIVLARYHCRGADKPASYDQKYPGLYNARRDNIEKYWKGEFGKTHAICVFDAFYEHVDRAGKDIVLQFQPTPAKEMIVACLYARWGAGKDELWSFAAITDEPPPEIKAAGHDRCVINLKPENVDAWLSPAGADPAKLQQILSDVEKPYYEHQVMAA